MKRRTLLFLSMMIALVASLSLNAQTLTHSYTFDDGTANDGTGSVNGVLEGTASIVDGELVLATDGDYVSFDGATMDLNSYSAVTMEFKYMSTVGANDSHWNWLSYFGGAEGASSLMAGVNTWGQYRVYKNNTDPKIEVASDDDGLYHHVVVVMTDAKIAMYADGLLIGEQATATYAIDATYAYLGRAYWSDPTWMGNVDEFNIYNGELDATTIYNTAAGYLYPSVSTLDDIALSTGALTVEFDPATLTYSAELPVGTTAVTPTVTKTSYFSEVTGDDEVDVSLGSGTSTIVVTSYDESTTTTYTINYTVLTQSIDATLSNIELSAGTLSPDFSAETTTYYVAIPSETTTIVVTPTVNDETATYTGGGSIDVSAGEASDVIEVTAEDGTTKIQYTINFLTECYEAYFSDRLNLIEDPSFSAGTLTDGGYGGWGPTAITDPDHAYCGVGAAYIMGSCWPNGGSIDRSLNSTNGNALEANTTYRLRAMINSQATEGTSFQFQIEGYDGTSSLFFQLEATTGWVQFDETFTTGETVTEAGIYFNSCTNAPAITDTCFIDNYELYKVDNDMTLSSLTASTGTLSEDFDPAVTSYSLVVDPATTSVTLTGVATSGTSNVTGDGEIALTDGSGTAEVVVTAESGNSQTYTINIVSNSTAIVGAESAVAKVYPTVSTGEVTVEFADTPKAITVYSLTGSVVKQIANPSVKEVVSIDGNGVYMVKVESQTSSQLVKVIIAQ